jgi:hypothetical protein
MPFPLLVPLLAIKGAVVGRFVYRKRVRARADRQFRCRVAREERGATGHIYMLIGMRELIVYYESGPAADFVVSRDGMKWVNGDPEVTDGDLKIIHTTLSAWAKARGSTVVGFGA